MPPSNCLEPPGPTDFSSSRPRDPVLPRPAGATTYGASTACADTATLAPVIGRVAQPASDCLARSSSRFGSTRSRINRRCRLASVACNAVNLTGGNRGLVAASPLTSRAGRVPRPFSVASRPGRPSRFEPSSVRLCACRDHQLLPITSIVQVVEGGGLLDASHLALRAGVASLHRSRAARSSNL